MTFDFNKAVFTCAVSDREMACFHRHLTLQTRQLVVNHTDATAVYHSVHNGSEAVIAGLCTDTCGQIEREGIAQAIVSLPEQTPEAVYAFADRLCGKYIIVYSGPDGCYAFGDATCSIPANYAGSLEDGRICISPFDRMTAAYFRYDPDPELQKMRESADPAQAMPGDLTPYRQVRALLPNQYLNILTGEAVRVQVQVPEMPFEEITDRSVRLAATAAREFSKHYSLVCPLTSGYDSRVVLSVLQQVDPDVECFTTAFSAETKEDANIRTAAEICRQEGISHRIFGYYDLPDEYNEAVQQAAGLINSTQTIREAYSYLLEAGDKARVNGNIIGQIGKSSVTNCVPDSLAGASFFTCKIHNSDSRCRDAMKQYTAELKKSDRRICDLFAYENRCGRWGGQEEALYSLCGMNSLNIFNCREMILLWMAVPRKQRIQKSIHLAMIRRTNPGLLSVPFNPDDRFSFLKSNWVFYYFATFAKQMLVCRGIACD